MIIAFCGRCHGLWQVRLDRNPETLEGACGECGPEGDVERPLLFGMLFNGEHDVDLDVLPDDWVIE